MSSELFPVHGFTEYKKYEITNRMECLINKVPEVCIQHCDSIPDLPQKERFKCYKQYDISTSIYGREYCGFLHNKTTEFDVYYRCIRFNKVEDITLKEACQISKYDLKERLECYKGKVIKGVGTVPYDKEFCQLENKIEQNNNLHQLFDCYRDKAKLNMTNQLCKDIYPGEDKNMTNVEIRYGCQIEHMKQDGHSYDREYCNLKTKTW